MSRGSSQVLYIMQGAPGSGKSTVAKSLANRPNCVICSTDDYFVEEGVYRFRPEKLAENHAKNLDHAIELMQAGISVIVDNTNIKRWQCRPYVNCAVALGIPVVFVRVEGRFCNTHGVPTDKVEQMRSEMETLTIDSVLAGE